MQHEIIPANCRDFFYAYYLHINSSLKDQPTFQYDETGKITGYKTKAGADTVFPFKSGGVDKIIFRLVKTYDAPSNYTNRHIYADLYSDDDLVKSIEVIVFQAYGDVANKVITTWTLN